MYSDEHVTMGNILMHIHVNRHCSRFAACTSPFSCNYMNIHMYRALLHTRKEKETEREEKKYFNKIAKYINNNNFVNKKQL